MPQEARSGSKMMTKKMQLDQKVANQLLMNRKKVSPITTAFIKAIMMELIEGNLVRLDGFGDLRIQMQKGKAQMTPGMPAFELEKRFVRFKKSREFRNLIQTTIGGSHGKVRRRRDR
jgi:nucleoid DNA-binding protein